MNGYILALPICRWGSKALSVLQWHSEFYLCSETQSGFFTGPTCFHILCSIRKSSFERAFGCQHTFLPTMFFFVICTSILFIFVCFRIFVLLYLFTNSFRRGFEVLLLCERGDSARFHCLLCCSEHTLWTTFCICILYLYTPVLYIFVFVHS